MNLLEISCDPSRSISPRSSQEIRNTPVRDVAFKMEAEKALLDKRLEWVKSLPEEGPLKVYLKNLEVLNQKNDLSSFTTPMEARGVLDEAFNSLALALKDPEKSDKELEKMAYKASYVHFSCLLEEALKKHPLSPVIQDLVHVRNSELSKTQRHKGSQKPDTLLSFEEKVEKSLWIVQHSPSKTPYRKLFENALKNVFSDYEGSRFSKIFVNGTSLREQCLLESGLTWIESAPLLEQFEVKSDLNQIFLIVLESFLDPLSSDFSLLRESFNHRDFATIDHLVVKHFFDFILTGVKETVEESNVDFALIREISESKDFLKLYALVKEYGERDPLKQLIEEIKQRIAQKMLVLMNSFSEKILGGKEENLTPYETYFQAKRAFRDFYEGLKKDLSFQSPERLKHAEEAYCKKDVSCLLRMAQETAYTRFLLELEDLSDRPELQALCDLRDSLEELSLPVKIEKTIEFLRENNHAFFSKPLRLILKDKSALSEPEIQEVKVLEKKHKTPQEVAEEIRPLLFKDQISYLLFLLGEPNINECLGFLAKGNDRDACLAAYEILKAIGEEGSEDEISLLSTIYVFSTYFLNNFHSRPRLDSLSKQWDKWLEMKTDSPLKQFIQYNGFLYKDPSFIEYPSFEIANTLQGYLGVFVSRLKQEAKLIGMDFTADPENLLELDTKSKEIGYQKFLFWLNKFSSHEKYKEDPDLIKLTEIQSDYASVQTYLQKVSESSPKHLQILKSYLENVFLQSVQDKKIQDVFPWTQLKNPNSLLSKFFQEMGEAYDESISWERNCVHKIKCMKSFILFVKQESKKPLIAFENLDKALKSSNLLEVEQALEELCLEKNILIKGFKKKTQETFQWFLEQPFISAFDIPKEKWDKNSSDYEKFVVSDLAFVMFYQGLSGKIRKINSPFYDNLLKLALEARDLTSLDWIFKEVSYQCYLVLIEDHELADLIDLDNFLENSSIDDKIRKTREYLQKNYSIYVNSGIEELLSFPDFVRIKEPLSKWMLKLRNNFIDFLVDSENAHFVNYLISLKGKERPILLKEDQIQVDYKNFLNKLRSEVLRENQVYLEAELSNSLKTSGEVSFYELDRIVAYIVKSDRPISLSSLMKHNFFRAALVFLSNESDKETIYPEFLSGFEKIPSSKRLNFIDLLLREKQDSYIEYALNKGNSKVKQAIFESLKEGMKGISEDDPEVVEDFLSFFMKTYLFYSGDSIETLDRMEMGEERLSKVFSFIKDGGLSPLLLSFFEQEGLIDNNRNAMPFVFALGKEVEIANLICFIRNFLGFDDRFNLNKSTLEKLDQSIQKETYRSFLERMREEGLEETSLARLALIGDNQNDSWDEILDKTREELNSIQKNTMASSLESIMRSCSPLMHLNNSFSWRSLDKSNSFLAKFLERFQVEPISSISPASHYIQSKKVINDFTYFMKSKLELLKDQKLSRNALYYEILEEGDSLFELLTAEKYNELAELVDKILVLDLQEQLDSLTQKSNQYHKLKKQASKVLEKAKKGTLFPSDTREALENLFQEHGVSLKSSMPLRFSSSAWKQWILKQPFKDRFILPIYSNTTSNYHKNILLDEGLQKFTIWLNEEIDSLGMSFIYKNFVSLSYSFSSMEPINWVFKEVSYARYLKFLETAKDLYPGLISELSRFNESIKEQYTETKIESIRTYLEKNEGRFEPIAHKIMEQLFIR